MSTQAHRFVLIPARIHSKNEGASTKRYAGVETACLSRVIRSSLAIKQTDPKLRHKLPVRITSERDLRFVGKAKIRDLVRFTSRKLN